VPDHGSRTGISFAGRSKYTPDEVLEEAKILLSVILTTLQESSAAGKNSKLLQNAAGNIKPFSM
jgi:hypothetical protein